MKKNAFVLYSELQEKYGGAITLASSPPGQPNHRNGRTNECALWIHTSPSYGGRKEWHKVRRRPKDAIEGLCKIEKCNGKCRTAHSAIEDNIWKLFKENNLYLEGFIYTAQKPDEPVQENETPQTPRQPKQIRARRFKVDTDPKLLNKFKQFFAKWEGRFLLVCKQCYSLEPKVIKEMEISDGKDPKVYCRWCLGKKYMLLHEATFKGKIFRGKNIIFHEYNAIRQIQTNSVNDICRHPANCSRGDGCVRAHSNLELEFWSLDSSDILFSIIRYCNSRANSARDTLDGMFYCEYCCLSFLQAQDYHKYMKRPHKHFDEIHRSTTCWRYNPLPRLQQVLDRPFELCRSRGYCPKSCEKAHSEKEREEWNERKKIATVRSRFSLQVDATWFDLTELPQDIQEESRVNVIIENPRRQINIADKSVKWTLEIECTDKQFILYKIGFCQNSGFEVRKDDENSYKSLIHLNDDEKQRHKFKVLFINPKDTYGTITQDLICEFTGSKHYRLQFQVDVAGDDMKIPEIAPRHYDDNWVEQRTIIRYDNPGTQTNSYDDKVKEHVRKYRWKRPVNDIDMSNLSPHNYAEKMHDLLYAEEECRRAVLSRLNIKSEIRYGIILPNGNMVATFFIPISVSTDEALLFKSSCTTLLIGADEDIYAYECKIITFAIEGKMDSQDMTQVTIDVPATCRDSLNLEPNSNSTHKIQFQLDRTLFGLRHYAVDNICDNIALLCPSKDNLASPPDLPHTRMCEKLDSVQDIVRQYVICAKNAEDAAKFFPPLVVAGPFGTGKTHTIKQILENLLRNSDSPSILVCTHTNSAADLYLEDPRLAAFGPKKILRVVYHGRNLPSIPADVRKFCLYDENGRLRYPTLPEIMQCQLIVTTFTTAMCIFLESGFGLFKHIFLDESSQAMEADVVMPLLLADRENTRIIIAGDHRQTTEKMYSDEKDQVKTLLERLYETPKENKVITIRLRNNYRCVKGILELISKLFYKKNALRNASRAQCVTGLNAVYFVHIQGECLKTLYGDYANQSEANQILYEVDMLVNKRQILNQSDIVIVSTFRSQVEYIRQLFRRRNLGDVSVMSVEQIQGQEFKVVILTTVLRRINCLETPGENFGFLSDFRLLNVALSRAKSLVVVVGDAITLCSIGKCKKEWKVFLQHCEETNTILPQNVNVDSVKKQISLARKELRPSATEFIPGSKFTLAVLPQGTDELSNELTNEEVSADSTTIPSDIEDTSSYEDDDDTDSWCSEVSLDDIILNDMAKDKPIELSKVTLEVGEDHREFLQYALEDADDGDEDPNEILERPSRISRRKQRRTAIYPKYTIDQLEQMLKRDTVKYKRCKINIKNWYSAEAVPLNDEADQNLPEDLSVSNETDKSSSDNDEDPSNEVAYEMSLGLEPAVAVPITRISNIIYIETRLNLGRTFDQDEALVELIGTKRDPNNPVNIKRIGKVLGILRKRHIHPRNRYFLCRPYDLSPALMIPYNKKLTCFAILSPMNESLEFGTVPMHKFAKHKSRNGIRQLIFEGFEKVEETKVYVVRYLKWSECCPYPLGFVESSFHSTDFQRYLSLEYRVPTDHKTEVMDEVRRMEKPDFNNGISYIDVFTIDPEGSKDLDDAISFSKCSEHRDCYEIGIHITDVASIVREGTAVDKDAQRRRSTFYGPEQPIHMLPGELSTRICSILPNMIRQAISTTFHSCEPPHSQNYTPVKPERTYIKSSRKLTYSEAEKLYKAVELNKLDQLEGDDERYANMIHSLWKIMWEWRLARLKGEAFYKRADTFEHILDSQAHLLIEEAMIATNCNTAQYLTERGYDIPMRMQDMPLEEDWTRWEKVHANLIPNSCYMQSMKKHLKKRQRICDGGSENDSDDDSSESDDDDDGGGWENVQNRRRQKSKWKVEKPQTPAGPIQERDSITMFKNYWAVMKKAKDEGDMEGFTFVAACDDLHPSQIATVNGFIRTQKKAYFTTQDSFHFSLHLQKYTWSTSPIRRYADILVQRCILKSLDSERLCATTKQDIKQFCSVGDNRHKEFEDRFTEAVLAKSFEGEPVVLEACIEQVTDAFVKISIPLAKFVKYQHLQIPFRNLMVAEADNESENVLVDSSAPPISCMKLGWKLRYYQYSDQRTFESEPSSVVKLPIREWKQLVQLLSARPRLTREHEIENNKLELRQAIQRLCEAAEVEGSDKLDILTCETRNEPIPIKHKREIAWRVKLGTTILVQLSNCLNTTQLPTPDIQLFSIANNLDVCVEHMKEPLTVYAKDAMKPFNGEIRTLKQYRGRWEPLVRMDAANSAVKENSSITIQGIKISWKKLEGLEAGEGSFFETSDTDNDNSFQLKNGFCSDRYIDIHPGDLLCLRLKGVRSTKTRHDRHHQKLSPHGMREHYTAVIHALVTNVDKASIKSREDAITFNFQVVSGKIHIKVKAEDLWTVEVVPLSFAHRYMQKALCGIASPWFDYDLLQSICLEMIEPTPVPWNNDVKNKWINRDLAKFKFKLNREQRSQEQRAIMLNFSLIQGPPGTGKSFLGAHIAAKFAYMNKDGGSKNKVIYVGPSNKSVDVAAGYLIDIKDLKVIRMYSKSLEEKLYPNPLKPDQSSQASEEDSKAPDSRLKTISLHEMIRFSSNKSSKVIKDFDARVKNGDRFTRTEMNDYNRIITMAKIKELLDADIVICTCSCSCQLTDIINFLIDEGKKNGEDHHGQSKSKSEMGELNFAQCIIDECAMCSEPETILPLFAVKPQQVVLIGDHMQLRPVVTCNKAERLGLSESLFMRYKEHAGMLTTQYRMHPGIMKFPSDKFYDGRLVCDDSVHNTTSLRRNDSFNRRIRAFFWNVKGEEGIRHFKTKNEGDQSKFNNAQAHAVVQLLLRLHSYNIPLEKIMILSPYTAQCARIREILKRKSYELAQVHVGTVVTSQGSESDYVILSTVRALPSSSIMPLPNLQWLRKHLGFLTDPNQINVALTRAKKRLFIIGDRELLRVDTLWRDLLSSYERNGAVTDNLLGLQD